MALTELTYNLTRPQLEKARTDLATQGINLVGDVGDISYKGVQLHFTYIEPKLDVTIADSGMWPMFIVKGKVNGWFKTEEA